MLSDPFVMTGMWILLILVLGGVAQYLNHKYKKEDLMKLQDFFKAAETFAPLVLTFVPGVPAAVIPFVINGLKVAEAIPGASGQDKLAAAVIEVNNGIASVNAIKPGSIDADAVNSAVVQGINATVATINAVHSFKNDPPTPPPAQ